MNSRKKRQRNQKRLKKIKERRAYCANKTRKAKKQQAEEDRKVNESAERIAGGDPVTITLDPTEVSKPVFDRGMFQRPDDGPAPTPNEVMKSIMKSPPKVFKKGVWSKPPDE